MLYTKRALVTEALRQMRVVGLNEDPPSEVMVRTGEIYDRKLEEWRDRDLVYWTNAAGAYDTEEIPGPVFSNLVALLINRVEAQFGKNTNLTPLDRDNIEDRLLRSVRRHTHMQSARRPQHVDYF